MDDTFLLVEVLQRIGYLNDDMPAQILTEVGQPDDLVEEFPPGAELQYYKVVLT